MHVLIYISLYVFLSICMLNTCASVPPTWSSAPRAMRKPDKYSSNMHVSKPVVQRGGKK